MKKHNTRNPQITEALKGLPHKQVWDLLVVLAKSGNRRRTVLEEIQARASKEVWDALNVKLKEVGKL